MQGIDYLNKQMRQLLGVEKEGQNKEMDKKIFRELNS